MPFKSKSQRKACHAKKDPRWDCKKWEKHTPKNPLPEKVEKKK